MPLNVLVLRGAAVAPAVLRVEAGWLAGRLALGVAERLADGVEAARFWAAALRAWPVAVPVGVRAAPVPACPEEPQPRASRVWALDIVDPEFLRRFWSGCHFCRFWAFPLRLMF